MSIRGFNPTLFSEEKITINYHAYKFDYIFIPSPHASYVKGADYGGYNVNITHMGSTSIITKKIGIDLLHPDLAVIDILESKVGSNYTLIGFTAYVPQQDSVFNLLASWNLLKTDTHKVGNTLEVDVYGVFVPNILIVARGNVNDYMQPEPIVETLGKCTDFIKPLDSIPSPSVGLTTNGLTWTQAFVVAYNPLTGEFWGNRSEYVETYFRINYGPYSIATIYFDLYIWVGSKSDRDTTHGDAIFVVIKPDGQQIVTGLPLKKTTTSPVNYYRSTDSENKYRIYAYGITDGSDDDPETGLPDPNHNLEWISTPIASNIQLSNPDNWRNTY